MDGGSGLARFAFPLGLEHKEILTTAGALALAVVSLREVAVYLGNRLVSQPSDRGARESACVLAYSIGVTVGVHGRLQCKRIPAPSRTGSVPRRLLQTILDPIVPGKGENGPCPGTESGVIGS